MVCMVPLTVCEGALKKVAWRLGEIGEALPASPGGGPGMFTDKNLKLNSLAISLAILLTLKYPCF